MKKRILILFLFICSFISSIAPITVYFILNADKYIKTREDAIRLSLGGIVCLILALIKISGKFKLPSSTVCFGVVFLLSYLLRSVTNDILIFSFLALVGDICERVFFMLPIAKLKRGMEQERSAEITASKVESAIERYFRGGE